MSCKILLQTPNASDSVVFVKLFLHRLVKSNISLVRVCLSSKTQKILKYYNTNTPIKDLL